MAVKTVGVLEFQTDSPVHVGIGGEEVVRELIRLSSGELVIPSSTWKGSFRYLSEQIAKQMEFKKISSLSVKLYSETKSGIGYQGGSKELREEFNNFVSEFVKMIKAEDLKNLFMQLGYSDLELKDVENKGIHATGGLAYRMAEDYLAVNCPLGRLYGNRVFAGKLRFCDSVVSTKSGTIVERKPGVGIDRRSGKVMENLLYFTETVTKGVLIRLIIVADNLLKGQEDSKVLGTTLKTIKTLGLQIGGRKSTGLGNLRMVDGRFYVLDLEEDYKEKRFAIGNPLKKLKSFNIDEYADWLCI
jgi:CRISPR/Cas system CSM-associated protein Csm3 (group 7 of RAMP superfamily)